jgi:hypothetical protein
MKPIHFLFAALLALFVACGAEKAADTPDKPDTPAQESGEKMTYTPHTEEPLIDDQGRKIHRGTGLVIADGWTHVVAHCIACHSPKQFLRQRGTKATWQYIIDWMQDTQGLWEFPPGVEDEIIDYLATNYGPTGDYRRAPIPATLMPQNPYGSEIQRQLQEKGETPKKPGE